MSITMDTTIGFPFNFGKSPTLLDWISHNILKSISLNCDQLKYKIDYQFAQLLLLGQGKIRIGQKRRKCASCRAEIW